MTEKKILVDLLNYMFDENREPWNNETNEKIIDSYLASNSYLSLHGVSYSFYCGKERVYGEHRCEIQCNICKKKL